MSDGGILASALMNAYAREAKRKTPSLKRGIMRALYPARMSMSLPRSLIPQRDSFKRSRLQFVEVKAVDVTGLNTTFVLNTSASGTLLNLVQSGATFYQRTGRKLAGKSLNIHGTIIPVTAGTLGSEQLTMYVIYDAQPNGAAAQWSDIVQNVDQNGGITNTALDHFNLNNRDRFKILAKFMWYLPVYTTGSGGSNQEPHQPTMNETKFTRFIKLNGLETQYKSESNPAVIGDVQSGAIQYLLQGTVGGQYKIQASSRYRYTDT